MCVCVQLQSYSTAHAYIAAQGRSAFVDFVELL